MTLRSTVSLTKHHGLGNDFLIAVEPEVSLAPTDALSWCDRRTGIGADGLIVSDRLADNIWSMLLLNADGSRAEISGNGIRCLAQALGQHEGVDLKAGPHGFEIRTDGGLRTVELSDDRRFQTIQVKVDMGPAKNGPPPSDKWDTAGVTILDQAGINIGNPHLVVHVESPDSVDLATVGPLIEADCPEGLNVQFATTVDDGSIWLRPWERGAGITQACGSGACVSAYQFHRWGLVGDRVEVHMPGGSVDVEIADDAIHLRGPATFIGSVTVHR